MKQILKPVRYDDIPRHYVIGDTAGHVVVEWQRAILTEDGKVRVVPCYVPAIAEKDGDGIVTITYEDHPGGSIDPYFARFAFHEGNLPDLYEFTSLGARECMLVSLGYLLGYDDEANCFRTFLDDMNSTGEKLYKRWRDIPILKANFKIWTEYYK